MGAVAAASGSDVLVGSAALLAEAAASGDAVGTTAASPASSDVTPESWIVADTAAASGGVAETDEAAFASVAASVAASGSWAESSGVVALESLVSSVAASGMASPPASSAHPLETKEQKSTGLDKRAILVRISI
jgi:hypothetical protein